MIQTVEAIIDASGKICLLQQIALPGPRRAFVTVLDEEPSIAAHETALLSEPALAEEWNLAEEDAAWSHLHPAR